MPKLESVEVVLLHYNLVNNNYQKASKVLFTFMGNKILRFNPLKCGLLIKIVNPLKLKIMLI